MDDCRVWTVLVEQGRMVRWLARVTGIPAQRLYDCKNRGNWLRHEEAEAISHALGVPRDMLFGPRARVLPPGRRTGRPGRKKKVRMAGDGRQATGDSRDGLLPPAPLPAAAGSPLPPEEQAPAQEPPQVRGAA